METRGLSSVRYHDTMCGIEQSRDARALRELQFNAAIARRSIYAHLSCRHAFDLSFFLHVRVKPARAKIAPFHEQEEGRHENQHVEFRLFPHERAL